MLDMSLNLLLKQKIHMKYQALFFLNNNKNGYDNNNNK